MSRATLIAILIALIALIASPVPAQPDVRSIGTPLIFQWQSGELENGVSLRAWSGLIAMLGWAEITFPDGETATQWMVTPLIQHERITSQDASKWVIFPFVWYHQGPPEGDGGRGFAVIPLYWRERIRFGELASSTFYLFPFFRREDDLSQRSAEGEMTVTHESRWGIWPVTWGWVDETFHHFNVFYPLNIWEPGHRLHIFPVLWWGQNYLSILPPLWGRWDGSASLPLEGHPEPVPVREHFQYVLFPLWLHFTQEVGEEGIYDENHLLWPILAWGDGGGRWERRVFPLYRQAHWEREGQERDRLWLLTPLYWRRRDHVDGEQTLSYDFLVPLLWNARWREPWEGGREQHVEVLFPLWIRHLVNDETRALWAPFPLLYAAWGDPESEDATIPEFQTRIGILLSGYSRWANGDSLFDILLFGFTRERQDTEIRTRTLLIFSTQRDPVDDTARVALLWRLFEYERAGDDRGLRLLYMPWRIPLP
ncbi:hypothetical protein JXA47_00270 [Candidatus Sumerlaeota bacterium]|nr:hypothetical protein [Candidatus Sumerlaeota bacterium]